MPRFFVENEAICADRITISGEDARHISHSLRMKPGEKLTVCGPDGTEYLCAAEHFTAGEVSLAILSRAPSANEPPYRVTVYQSLVRGERFDAVIQKSVEFGAAAVVPVAAARSEVRLSAADAEKKRVRWQRIAQEAAKQCGRAYIPAVAPPVPFEKAVSEAGGTRLFCYENERTLHLRDAVARAQDKSEFSIFIGPEGGFSAEEAALAVSLGADAVSLGRRILRTESAAPFVLACLSYALEV